MRKFLLIFVMMLCGNLAHAGDTPPCVAAIGNDTAAFVDVLKTKCKEASIFVLKHGEESKNLDNFAAIE